MPIGNPSPPEPDMRVSLGSLKLSNPLISASGTYSWKPDDGHPLDPNELGAIVTKSITLEPHVGNPPPRIYEAPGVVLNSIGIPSSGIEAYRSQFLNAAGSLHTRIITSITGFSAGEFGELCARLNDERRVDAIEINLSCPNIETASIYATDVRLMAGIIRTCRKNTRKFLITKLSPSVPDIQPFALASEDAGSDALCIANTFTGIVIDPIRKAPVLGNVRGGVTGPGLLPIILNHVWNAVQVTTLPIIASGGVYAGLDAVQYLLAGAKAVQVGTASFREPLATERILSEIRTYLLEGGYGRLMDIIGLAHMNSSVKELTNG